MRPTIGGLVVLVGLAMTVVLVLLLFGNLGMRSELESARAELAALRADVTGNEATVTTDELERQLDDLEARITDALLVDGADGGSGATPGTGDDIGERLDEIIERIQALDDRIDEICGNVPVC